MSFFESRDPSVRELVAYIVRRALDREATVTQTKLVKLVYLVDVGRQARRGRTLTGLEWRFYHFGPYAFALADELERMEGREIVTKGLTGSAAATNVKLYIGAPDAPDAVTWPTATKLLVDGVVDHWSGEELNRLLDHVYFSTGPMRGARRGEILDFSKVDPDRIVQSRPLAPPPRPDDADQRLAQWREGRRRRRSPMRLDPPPRYDAELLEVLAEGADAEPNTDLAHGQLSVPDGTEL
jgi:hypothetical protein